MIIALGVVMIIAGVAAIISPYVSSLGVSVCVGVMLIVAGIAQAVSSFRYSGWGRVLLGLLVAVLWAFGGGYLLARPLEGMFVMTVVVAAGFIASGIVKTVASFGMRPLGGWGWLLFDGIMSVALGVLLWLKLPVAALWALGLLAGINIMFSGLTLVMVPIAISRTVRHLTDGSTVASAR